MLAALIPGASNCQAWNRIFGHSARSNYQTAEVVKGETLAVYAAKSLPPTCTYRLNLYTSSFHLDRSAWLKDPIPQAIVVERYVAIVTVNNHSTIDPVSGRRENKPVYLSRRGGKRRVCMYQQDC